MLFIFKFHTTCLHKNSTDVVIIDCTLKIKEIFLVVTNNKITHIISEYFHIYISVQVEPDIKLSNSKSSRSIQTM